MFGEWQLMIRDEAWQETRIDKAFMKGLVSQKAPSVYEMCREVSRFVRSRPNNI